MGYKSFEMTHLIDQALQDGNIRSVRRVIADTCPFDRTFTIGNFNETLQILSFNPETDFSLMAYESAVDNAYLQYLNVLDKERKTALESSIDEIVLLISDVTIAEESITYSDITLEEAKGNFKEKLISAWEAFKKKAIAFFNKAANVIKNLATNIHAKLVSKMVSKEKPYALGEYKYKFLENLKNLDKQFSSFKTSDGKTTVSDNENLLNNIKKILEDNAKNEDKIRGNRREQMLNNNRHLIAVDGDVLKDWLKSITNIINTGSNTIGLCNRLIKSIDKNTYMQDQDEETVMNDRELYSQYKENIQLAINVSRKGLSYITETIAASNMRRKSIRNTGDVNTLI